VEEWPEEEGEPFLRAAWARLLERRRVLLQGFDPEDERWAEETLRLALWVREQRLKELLTDLHALADSAPDWPQEEFMAKWQRLTEALNQIQRFRYRRAIPEDRLSTTER
ncbi:MAG: hypothetical protein J7452_11915, partial [Thermoflexus sp.]|nr:hypothetical protein [Thermoflexus sp.]